jgi:DNA polymerase-3 subunit epsilon
MPCNRLYPEIVVATLHAQEYGLTGGFFDVFPSNITLSYGQAPSTHDLYCQNDYTIGMNFTALDVDIARPELQSICRVGLICIENDKMVYQAEQLVKPPKNAYSSRQRDLHGQLPHHTENAPLWPEVWADIRVYIENKLIIAPKAAFTLDCLFHAQNYYMLPHPIFNFECIYCMTGMNLADAGKEYGLHLEETTGPLSRAIAAARLYMLMHKDRPALMSVSRI